MRMAENRRPPRADVVDESIPVDVPDARAFGLAHKKRLAANGAKSPDRRIYTAGDVLEGLSEKLF